MPIAQQHADPGLKAIKNILDAPEFLPASVVDLDLSAIKAVQRGDSGLSHMLSSRAVSTLEAELQKAVAQGGKPAQDALAAGRAATISKVAAKTLREQLRDEPVQVFQQVTWRQDAGIDRLKELAREAPDALPQMGRAYLDDLVDIATREGGFDRARTLQNRWADLGNQTKTLLFPNAGHRADLDRFFLLAKQIGTTPNPSGTGHIASLLTQGGLLITEPITGGTMVVSGGVLSALLHSPAAVKALTTGLRVPIGGNRQAAVATFAVLQQAIQQAQASGGSQ
jgi:hypothetical protein